jgi:hypothetical protein
MLEIGSCRKDGSNFLGVKSTGWKGFALRFVSYLFNKVVFFGLCCFGYFSPLIWYKTRPYVKM